MISPQPIPKRRATIIDVAREAGVSTATVSNALTGRRRVDPDTERRVRAVANRIGYVPDLRAQRLRTGDARILALLSSMPLSISAGASRLGFFMEIAASIAVEAMQEHLTLMLVPPPEAGTATLPLEQLDIDGAFVLEPLEADPIVEVLCARRIPLVTIGRQPGAAGKALPHVELHPGRTTELLLSHLLAEGARRIALVVGAQARSSSLEAEATYRRIEPAPLVLRLDEDGGEALAFEQVGRLLDEHKEIDALCVTVDTFATGAARAALSRGLVVPEKLRIATRYDGLRARTATPPLTAVDMRLDAVARSALSLMLGLLRGTPAPVELVLPTELVIRRSSRA